MASISQIIKDDSLFEKNNYFQIIFALIFFSIIILGYSFIGLTLPLFLAIVICALIFFIPSSNYLGLICITGLTMFFERVFTLQPLIIGESMYKIYPLDALMAVAFIALILNIAFGVKKIKWGWPETILIIFLILMSLNMARGLADINANFATAFSSFKNYFWYPLIYFLALYSVDSKEKLKKYLKLILIFAIGLIGFIVYGIVNGQGLWTEFTPLSTEGTRILASTHAFYLSIALIISISLMISGRFKNVLFTLLIIWIWLVGIIGSMMRHLWLGIAIAVVALFIAIPIKEKKELSGIIFKNAIIIITIALAAFLFFNLLPNSSSPVSGLVSSTQNRIVSFFSTSDDSSVSWRMDLWRDAVHKWETNPFFGIGFGKQLSLDTNQWQAFEDVKNIHNSPLAILVQTGLMGLIVFIIFVLSVIIFSYKYVMQNEELRPYYFGIFASIVLFLFSSMFQPYLETNLLSIFLWILLGLLGTARILNKQE